VVIVLVCSDRAVHSFGQSTNSKENHESTSRPSLDQIQDKVEELANSRNMDGLITFLRQLALQSKTDISREVSYNLARGCSLLRTRSMGNRELQIASADEIASLALERHEGWRPDIELQLCLSLDVKGESYQGNDKSDWRDKRIQRLLETFVRVCNSRDINFDPANAPTINYFDPSGRYPSGYSPDAITDPVEREAYRKKFEAHKKQLKEFLAQEEYRRILDEYDIIISRIIANVYSHNTNGKNEFSLIAEKVKLPREYAEKWGNVWGNTRMQISQ